jgi:DinB superfamily
MQVLSPAPIQVPISLLEKMPGILEQLLHDAPPEVLHWKPAPERWSIQEVLAHLAVIEQIYSQRIRRMVMEEDPALVKHVAPTEKEFQQKTARQHLEHFIALRRVHVVFLHTVPAAAAGRTGRHHEMGQISVSQLLHELANHDLGHLRQMAELYRAHAFYPHTGPLQKYSHPKP